MKGHIMWKKYYKIIIAAIVGLLAGIGGAVGVVNITTTEEGQITVDTSFQIELPEAQVVETEDGALEVVGAPTVEEVDGGQIPLDMEQMSDEEQDAAAQGFAIDISTPWTVIAALNNKCITMGNPYGSQCVNTTNVISENQVGYWMSTCGTGAARGIWDCADYNARGGYELITDPTQLRPGDLFVTWGGEWGHTGMVAGYYSGGYVPVFSTNQGGTPCAEGGSAANTINLSMATFSGAFRWHGWDYLFVQPEPTPEPEVIPITGCKDWNVEAGDTMSGIMLNCEGTIVYGEAMDKYADSWTSQIVNPGYTVYYGWTHGYGYGLYTGDYLLHGTDK